MRRMVLCAATAVLALGALVATPAPASALPAVKHVFVIVLENKNYDSSFGANSAAPYLAKDLVAKGQLLTQYYGTGHLSLDNYIAMVSGQAPNIVTQSDCQIFQDFLPSTGPDANGQFTGQGCVYPAAVPTLMSQLAAKGLTWRGYMEDMAAPCTHPVVNAQDTTQQASAQSQYAVRHNPFAYFHSVIDDDVACRARVRPVNDLTADLATEPTTANFTFITPDLCHDGHDATCADPSQKGGLPGEDEFLQQWVPAILASPAYQRDGLLVIAYDESESGAEACCNELAGPNSPVPGGPDNGPGGGRTGAVVISPFVQPGSVNNTPYNHYSLLRSIEDLFALDHLGFAAADGLVPFGNDVFNRSATPAPSPSSGVAAAGAGRGGALPPTGGGTAAAGAAAVVLAVWLLARRTRQRVSSPTP
ncbi:MAG: hypothetical protein QOJ09_2182, partial [Actinomycetota bacterium]|nr:hypothetical protein [Actinomycetota bacterium]